MSILGNDHDSNQVSRKEQSSKRDNKPRTSDSPFYKLMSHELRQLYELKLLDAPAYVLLIVKTQRAAGWKWTFKVRDFCKEWGLNERSFYRAVSKLKTLGLLHWETGETITVWHSADVARGDSDDTGVISINTLTPVSVPVTPVSVPVTPVSVPVTPVSVALTPMTQEIAGTLGSTETAEASDSSQSYSDFKKTLSDSQRENFLNFGKKKASQLPKPPELPMKWIEANWEELQSQWEQTKEGCAAVSSQTNWTQHPDWEDWLAQMRHGVPSFVALGTCFDNKTRRAIADWALEHKLVWGAES